MTPMPAPPIPETVAAAFAAFPPEAREKLETARDAIFATAEATGTGPLTETLKWGEPAYLTEQTKAGTTIRLGLVGGEPAVLVHCQTTLIDSFRSDFPDAFPYYGNRALLLTGDYDPEALAHCLARALTYKRKRP